MKTIQLMLPSRWIKLLAVIFIAAWCARVDAAYWNNNRTQTHRQGADLDGDGIPNIVDPDIDNDSIPNSLDRNVDGGVAKSGPNQGKYIGDREDNDSPAEEDIDADGLPDDSLAEKDIDGDGRDDDDPLELDIDGDGRSNDDAAETDDDGDGVADVRDDDNNNIKDINESIHHPETGEEEVKVELFAQSAAPQGSSVKITLQHYGTGSAKFAVEALGLAVGSYELLVGGVVRGAVAVVLESEKTRGILIFKSMESGSGALVLDFPVAEQAIALRQAGTIYFSGTTPALPSIHSGDEGANSVPLTHGAGISNLAEVEVEFHFGSANPTQLEIKLETVPAGNYSVVISNVVRSTLAVLATNDGNEGELNFTVGGSLPLDFPTAGQPIEIVQGSTIFFFGQLPTAAP